MSEHPGKHAGEHSNRTTKTIVYGPVQSRRFGRSLGINISGPGKYCSFNCVYCFRGFNEGRPGSNDANFPDYRQIVSEIDEYIRENESSDKLDLLDDITIAGNGEPTDNRCLPEVIDYLYDLRETRLRRLKDHLKISILTNGMGFVPGINPRSDVLLSRTHKVDRLCVKIDSGEPGTWMRINNPGRFTAYEEGNADNAANSHNAGIRDNKIEFGVWFDAISKISDPFIQTMFINGRIDNTTEEELKKLMHCYEILKPQQVYLITIDKPPADAGILPVPAEKMQLLKKTLDEINAQKVKILLYQ